MAQKLVTVDPRKPSPVSVTRSVRIDSIVDSKLEELAEKERVSVNVLVNKALRKLVEWDVYADRFGMVTTSKKTMAELFNLMTDDQARQRGRESGAKRAVEFVTFLFKKFDLNSVLRSMEYLRDYGGNFTFDHSLDGKVHTIIFKHEEGPRASAYYAEATKAVFERLGLKTDVAETDSQLTLKVCDEGPC